VTVGAKMGAFRDRHRGQRILVAGKGPSLQGFEFPAGIPVIGVNDCEDFALREVDADPDAEPVRLHVPADYLVVVDKPTSFSEDQRRVIRSSHAHVFLGSGYAAHWVGEHAIAAPQTIFLMVGVHPTKRFPPFHDATWQIPCGGMSPLAACSIAAFMGASEIGLIGVDIHSHPALRSFTVAENNRFAMLSEFLRSQGRRIVNLSPTSALTSIRRMEPERWLERTTHEVPA
jgi:hypothetical protein